MSNGKIDSYEVAQAACSKLNQALVTDCPPKPSNLDEGKNIVCFEVRPFSFRHMPNYGPTRIPESWGLWPRWSYEDRPDLGSQFGGPFMLANEALGYT